MTTWKNTCDDAARNMRPVIVSEGDEIGGPDRYGRGDQQYVSVHDAKSAAAYAAATFARRIYGNRGAYIALRWDGGRADGTEGYWSAHLGRSSREGISGTTYRMTMRVVDDEAAAA